jgi:putative flippase GtrA
MNEKNERKTENSAKRTELFRALKFLLVSISAALVQIGSFALLQLTGWGYWACYLPSLILSVVWNFTINRKITFKSANNIPLAMSLVFLYYLVFTPLSTLWGEALTRFGWNEFLVLLLTMVINFLTEFAWQRLVVFKKSLDTAKKS